MLDQLMTLEEVAEYLSVPVSTIYRWNTMNTGPAYIKVGRHTRYRMKDIQHWLKEKEKKQ